MKLTPEAIKYIQKLYKEYLKKEAKKNGGKGDKGKPQYSMVAERPLDMAFPPIRLRTDDL
ncbi:MAG: hypothetical protein JO126_05390 [Alphaproteobacteria bacterium]|nr:hypothetical protein [Alphaproteobacteria bacterium]MBV8548870.1 hypothetical protein [Alphaproteobacteria bacterium]